MSESTPHDLPVSFASFVISLAGSAMMHLGQAPHPDSGGTSVNLPLARNTIDLLGMLQDKTQGNLDDEEKKMLETLLAELRSRYVDVSS